MLCSSHDTGCTEAQDAHSSGNVSPNSDPSLHDAASESQSLSVHKKPIKLDIAAILAGDSDTPSDSPDPTASAADESFKANLSAVPESAPSIPGAVHSSDSDPADSVVPAQPVNPAVILLIILCVILGLAILAVLLLIIWPNIIPVLFYHSTI